MIHTFFHILHFGSFCKKIKLLNYKEKTKKIRKLKYRILKFFGENLYILPQNYIQYHIFYELEIVMF